MTLIRITLIALVLAGLVMGAAVWVDAGTTGIVSGTVRSDDGKPLSGANVIITGTKFTTVTDANGYYAITNVPPGDYEVRAEMVGYANATANPVSVTMDSTADVKFEMKQEAIKETTAVVTRPRPMISGGPSQYAQHGYCGTKRASRAPIQRRSTPFRAYSAPCRESWSSQTAQDLRTSVVANPSRLGTTSKASPSPTPTSGLSVITSSRLESASSRSTPAGSVLSLATPWAVS